MSVRVSGLCFNFVLYALDRALWMYALDRALLRMLRFALELCGCTLWQSSVDVTLWQSSVDVRFDRALWMYSFGQGFCTNTWAHLPFRSCSRRLTRQLCTWLIQAVLSLYVLRSWSHRHEYVYAGWRSHSISCPYDEGYALPHAYPRGLNLAGRDLDPVLGQNRC